MLTPYEIEKRIEAMVSRNAWAQSRLENLKRLKKETRVVGEMIIKTSRPEGKAERIEKLMASATTDKELFKLDEGELIQLGEAMMPQIAAEFRAAWKLFEILPVQSGFMRKPLRAPTHPELHLWRRTRFLSNLLAATAGLEVDAVWLAEYGPYTTSAYQATDDIGIFLAAAINLGGRQAEAICRVLKESAEGLHEVGKFDRHMVMAFLCSENRDCWEYIEKLLLAAKRQEGLRQVILETVDYSHPGAFRRMLRVIVENGLSRFSSVVRAADVWLSFQLDSQSGKYVNDTLESLVTLLDDEAARANVLSGDDAEAAYLALWSIAFDDINEAIRPAYLLLSHKNAEMRFVGIYVLCLLDLEDVNELILPAVDDDDLRVASYAATIAIGILDQRIRAKADAHFESLPDTVEYMEGQVEWQNMLKEIAEDPGDFFERLQKLYERLPAKAEVAKPIVWPWIKIKLHRQVATDAMISALGQRPLSAVTPYLSTMSPYARQRFAEILARRKDLDGSLRETLMELIGDASPSVREAAVKAAANLSVSVEELPRFEGLLSRKASDLRRGVLAIILTMQDSDVLASARRLLEFKNEQQRLAGLDLLQQLKSKNRSGVKAAALAEEYRTDREKIGAQEQVYIEQLVEPEKHVAWTLDDALGLMDDSKRTQPTTPKGRGIKLNSPAAINLLLLFDAAVHAHREVSIERTNFVGDRQTELLGTSVIDSPIEWQHENNLLNRNEIKQPPLAHVWKEVWNTRPESARDPDGLEAARARALCSFSDSVRLEELLETWASLAKGLCGEIPRLRYTINIGRILEWILLEESGGDLADFSVNGFEEVLAQIPSNKLTDKLNGMYPTFHVFANQFMVLANEIADIAMLRGQWKEKHATRIFGLQRWLDEPMRASSNSTVGTHNIVPKAKSVSAPSKIRDAIPRSRVEWNDAVRAFDAGGANEHDLFDLLLGDRIKDQYTPTRWFHELEIAATALRKGKLSPAVSEIVRRAIDRVLQIELSRGETETIVTDAVLSLRYAGGADVLIRVLQAVGRDPKLQRNYSWRDENKSKMTLFSHLIECTVPGKAESPEDFCLAAKAANIGEDSLIAVAFYAPQWSRHVETALGWESFADAVWWFQAHTKENDWHVEEDIREVWNADIRKLTPLTLEDLVEGAVDVDWFDRVSKSVGEKRWKRMDSFAKYACRGGGHKRAQLFADAMSGRIKRADLFKEIETKRKQDSVRALGLVPLEKDAKKDVLERYKAMQEFVRTCRQFGSQRQASEKLAARIGQENLARTAGYPDPIRLQWAMEGLATADLARGPVTASVGDVTVQLAIDEEGLPEISVKRGEKALKSIPPDVKKNEDVQTLTERKIDLRRSASRMRQSLELAMCRGDRFSGEELCELLGNVILRPMLNRLVFAGDGILGYPEKEGKCLRDFEGGIEPIKKTEMLRLAHPVDFLASKAWTKWQRDCFASERVQPFKQIFRELYVLTEQEKSDKTFSRRYAGQQVNPRQALALLGSRGWVTAPEAGVFRAYHDEKLVAWIEFMETFYTPAEVEGLTLEKVRFAKRGADEPLSLSDVPPRLLSETLRDVDLIVSVAHRGGVDPEASASTVEMRAALLGETIKLLKLDNVRIKDSHAYIKGDMAEYSVHLGSATTHMLPGGALFIVPIHSQHRGRIFLPFADEDPKTAEMISKVLLLARDREIKDPNLINQIRGSQ